MTDEISKMIYEHALDLYEAGLMDKKTMKKFDELCLTPVPTFTPDEIKAIREKERVSQTVFAHYLNVSKNMISEWERGVKKPSGTALKLLTLVQHKGIEILA